MALDICQNVEPELRNRYESLCSDPRAAAEESDASRCDKTHQLVLIANDILFKNQVPEKPSNGFGF